MANGVVRLGQALDEPGSFRVVPGLPESDASRDPPPLLGHNPFREGPKGGGHLADELLLLLGRAEHVHDDDTSISPLHLSMIARPLTRRGTFTHRTASVEAVLPTPPRLSPPPQDRVLPRRR